MNGYRAAVRVLAERYQLVRPIGAGGMSEIWLGFDEVLDRAVAVKLLNSHESADPDAVARAQAEARCAARLNHPNAAGVYDFGLVPGDHGEPVPYLVMELVDGRTLAEHLAAEPLPPRVAVRVCAEIGAALSTAHAHGIVHGDVKPANVMLSSAGAKVLDFGAASPIGQESGDTVRGTLPYLAPELLRGAPAGPAADTYALGVLLVVCLTGELPEAGAGTLAGLDPVLAELSGECLDPNPGRRPSALTATLVLAEAVDARIHLPPVEAALADRPVGRPTGEALRAPTTARPTRSPARPPAPRDRRHPDRVGRHRA